MITASFRTAAIVQRGLNTTVTRLRQMLAMDLYLRRRLWRACLLPLLTGSLVAGCASTPTTQPTTESDSATLEETAQNVHSSTIPEPQSQKVAIRPFDSETLYALLTAEIAGQRNRFDVMLNNYVQQAQSTRDPEVTARATRIARFLNAHHDSLEMALQWTELAPDNPEAHHIAAAELIYANRLLEATEHAEVLLLQKEPSGFDAIAAQAMRNQDTSISLQLISHFQSVLKKYPEPTPNHSELYIGLSLLQQHTNQPEQALKSAERAINVEPDAFQAQVQRTRVLQQLGRDQEALASLKRMVHKHPENDGLRLQYARALMRTDLAKAQQEIETLLAASPHENDLRLTLALILFEREQFERARELFQELTNSENRQSTAHYYLGRIAIFNDERDAAIGHLGQVEPGVDFLPATAQLAELLVDDNQTQAALTLVREKRSQTQEDQSEQRKGLFLLETKLLTYDGAFLEAFNLLTEAINQYPQSTRLLYTRAMLFIRTGDQPNAEADFHRILTFDPNNAATLNALGYTLADLTDRLDEAYDYISRAYQLAPDDPAVIDSMGWVEYLRGNHQVALDKLQRAMAAMPDHEIAAHLGEVLWVTGNKPQALEVWQQGLELQPGSEIIHSTLDRLDAQLPQL